MGQKEIRKDAEQLHKKSNSNTPFKETGCFTSKQTYESCNRSKDEPTGRPQKRDIYLAIRIGKESRIVIEVAVCIEERRLALGGWKVQAEVISKAIRDTAQAEYTILMGKFTVNRVDVIVIVYAGEVAESCVA